MGTRNELRGLLKQSQTTSEINNEVRVRKKRSSHSRGKECVNESLEYSDELVKYMSKLSSYLQRMERKEESFQSNVLNVGVLDWGRLEKWKHGRARDCGNALSRGGERSEKNERKVSTFATTSISGVVPNDSHRCKIDDQVHTCLNLGKEKASSRDLQHSVHGIRCTLELELASRDSLNKQKITTCSYKSSPGRDHEGVNPGKSRRSRSYQEPTSGLLSEMGNSMGSLGMERNLVDRDMETQKRAGEIHVQEARERAKESGKQCVDKLDGDERIVGDSKAGCTSENQEFNNIVPGRIMGALPATISQLKDLRFLAISQNFISDEIPVSLGEVRGLRTLDLSYNQLTGIISPSIGSLSELSNLILCHNHLTGSIPPFLSQTLTRINLKRNSLTGSISPASLPPSLQYLSLAWNQLTGPMDRVLLRLNQLNYLDLSLNQLTGTIPGQIFAFPCHLLRGGHVINS